MACTVGWALVSLSAMRFQQQQRVHFEGMRRAAPASTLDSAPPPIGSVVGTLDIPRVRLSDSGQIFHDEQLHIKIPGYKEEYQDGFEGWHIERGAPPKPLGAAWLRFYFNNSTRGKVLSEITRAK